MHNILTKKTEFSRHKLKIQETALAAFCAQNFVVSLEKPKPIYSWQRRTETNKLVPTAPQIGLVAFKTKLIKNRFPGKKSTKTSAILIHIQLKYKVKFWKVFLIQFYCF